MENITQLAWFYLFLLWSVLTLAFITPKSWTLLGRYLPEGLMMRSLEWLWRVVIMGFLGAWLDSLTWVKPHTAPLEPAFYLGFITISIVLTLPALVYYFAVTNRLK